MKIKIGNYYQTYIGIELKVLDEVSRNLYRVKIIESKHKDRPIGTIMQYNKTYFDTDVTYKYVKQMFDDPILPTKQVAEMLTLKEIKCEYGASAVGSAFHSEWCPLHGDN